jgi:hypothetical protein
LLTHSAYVGPPLELVSDRGSQFANDIIKHFLEMEGTSHVLTMPYSKEENSVVERANKEVARWIKGMLYGKQWPKSQWSRTIPHVIRIHNASPCESLDGHTPASLVFGERIELEQDIFVPQEERKVNQPLSEWMSEHLAIQDAVIEQAKVALQEHHEVHVHGKPVKSEAKGSSSSDPSGSAVDSKPQLRIKCERRKPQNEDAEDTSEPKVTEFPIGSYVLRDYYKSGFGSGASSKLDTLRRGPYKVIAKSPEGNAYVIQNLVTGKEETRQIHLLRPYHYDATRDDTEVQLRQEAMKDYPDVFEVERVLEHKGHFNKKKELLFLVKWKNYSSEDNTWEPWKNVMYNEALHKYLNDIGRTNMIPASIIRFIRCFPSL